VNIWTSPWTPTLPFSKPTPNPNLVGLPDFQVADLIDSSNRTWNCSLPEDLFDMDSLIQIIKIHIPQLVTPDRWTWVPADTGQFSVWTAHEVVSLNSHSRASPFSPEIWSCICGLKPQHGLKHLLWKIAWNLLPVRTNTGCYISSDVHYDWICPCCKVTQETISHIFLDCSDARILWRSSPWPINRGLSWLLKQLPLMESIIFCLKGMPLTSFLLFRSLICLWIGILFPTFWTLTTTFSLFIAGKLVRYLEVLIIEHIV
jgi:hypothetical protein